MINAFRQETATHQLVTEKMKGIITKVTAASNHRSQHRTSSATNKNLADNCYTAPMTPNLHYPPNSSTNPAPVAYVS
jgi:hypothetical protein